MTYNVYTDGACSGNPGPGGYAFLVMAEGSDTPILKVSGCKAQATNNEMELMAVVRALSHLMQNMVISKGQPVNTIYVHSDSAYVVNSVNNNWIDFWKKNKWNTKGGTPVKNKELWEKLLEQLQNKKCHIRFVKVKGHSGNTYNEIVDKAAVAAIDRVGE